MKRIERGYLLPFVITIGSLLLLAGISLVKLGQLDSLCAVKTERQVQASSESYGDNIEEFTTYLEQTESPEDFLTLTDKTKRGGESVTEILRVSTGTTIFHDDFHGLLTDQWDSKFPLPEVRLLGLWVFDLGAGLTGDVFAGDEEWRNYSVSCRGLLEQGTQLSLLARARLTEDGLEAYHAGYNLLERPLRGGTFFIDKVRDGRPDERLASARGFEFGLGGVAWLIDVQHELVFTLKNENLRLEVDDLTVLTAKDENPIPNGRIGLRSLVGAVLVVDEITVDNLPEIRSRWRRP